MRHVNPQDRAQGAAAADGPYVDPDVDPSTSTCHLTLTLPLSAPKLLMLEIVERVAALTLVRSTPGIDKASFARAPLAFSFAFQMPPARLPLPNLCMLHSRPYERPAATGAGASLSVVILRSFAM